MTITSLQNNRIKNILKLYRQRGRSQQRKTVIEGYRAVLRAVENEYPLDELYICPALFLGENEGALIERAAKAGTEIIEVAETPFHKITTQARPEGLLAVAPQIHHSVDDHVPDEKGFYLIVEAIERPGNLGAMMRSADAAGVSAMIVCESQTDVYHPEVIRASVGMIFAVPVLEATSSEAIQWCKGHDIVPIAATPHTDALYTEVDMCRPLALVVGSEKHGLSDMWLEQVDEQVRIPMLGQADSLNVATATTLLLYEVVRQRRL